MTCCGHDTPPGFYRFCWNICIGVKLWLWSILNNFSVIQLTRTLFAPWRRIITYPGASIDEKFKAWGDNVFSRMIGFVVRLGVLIAAFFASLLVTRL